MSFAESAGTCLTTVAALSAVTAGKQQQLSKQLFMQAPILH
jgi:hypothetical protein